MFTGPVFCAGSEPIGSGGVAVPSELYRVVIFTHGVRTRELAFLMPNAANTGRDLQGV